MNAYNKIEIGIWNLTPCKG